MAEGKSYLPQLSWGTEPTAVQAHDATATTLNFELNFNNEFIEIYFKNSEAVLLLLAPKWNC